MKKAIGWIHEGLNTMRDKAGYEDLQRQLIKAYCKKHGIQLLRIVAGEFILGAEKAVRASKTEGIEAVVVANVEDVSVIEHRYEAYRQWFRARGVELIPAVGDTREVVNAADGVLDKVFDAYRDIDESCSAAGGVLFSFKPYPMSGTAQYRDDTRRREKKAAGGYIGGNAPMGYRVVNGALVVNPDEVPVVLCIMDRKHSGKTMMSTVDALNQNGYKTRRGRPFVISTVQSIWNNEQFYRGYKRAGSGGEWVKGQHAAIIKS